MQFAVAIKDEVHSTIVKKEFIANFSMKEKFFHLFLPKIKLLGSVFFKECNQLRWDLMHLKFANNNC